MRTGFLNGTFMPLDEVKISPLDRGFLFGEGIYEVIPCYEKTMIAWQLHVDRLWQGLSALDINAGFNESQLHFWCKTLVEKNAEPNQSIYIHVSRGVESKRFHAWDNSGLATLFMMTNTLAVAAAPDLQSVIPLHVKAELDFRWRRCNIKSTSLLGNVLHFQDAIESGNHEVLLMDEHRRVTEASTSNIFMVSGQKVMTPPLSSALLPGVTRSIMLSILRSRTDFEVVETDITFDQVLEADEIWLTSSTKGVVPVVKVNGQQIADGTPGNVWLTAAKLYFQHKFDF